MELTEEDFYLKLSRLKFQVYQVIQREGYAE